MIIKFIIKQTSKIRREYLNERKCYNFLMISNPIEDLYKKSTDKRTLPQQKTSHARFQGLVHFLRSTQTVKQMLQEPILDQKQEYFRNEIQ